jgi:hypothetical protein
MSTFQATIVHHTIRSARVIDAGDNLAMAKRAASKEFGGEMLDFKIVVTDRSGAVVAARRVADKRWS